MTDGAKRNAPIDAGDLVRVVRGEPDEAELAALVAGIIAAAAALGEPEPESVEPQPWSDHARRLGAGLHPGSSTWRWSEHR